MKNCTLILEFTINVGEEGAITVVTHYHDPPCFPSKEDLEFIKRVVVKDAPSLKDVDTLHDMVLSGFEVHYEKVLAENEFNFEHKENKRKDQQ